MKTVEYLAACKEKLEIKSDYELAKALGITRSALSAYRNEGVTFGKQTAIKVAKILGVHPLTVRADAQVERAKSPEALALLRELASKIVAVLVFAGVGGLLSIAGGRPAYAVAGGGFDISVSSDAPARAQAATGLCIACILSSASAGSART